MSVIVYRSGVLAADTRAFIGRNEPSPGAKAKIRKLPKGVLIGCTTPIPGAGEQMMDWYARGADPKDEFLCDVPETYSLVAVKPDGTFFIYIDSLYPTGPVTSEFFALGSGDTYALGALHQGATAIEAVEAACKYDPNCALPTMSFTHKAAPK